MLKMFSAAIVFLLAAAAGFCAFAWYDRYWLRHECFNELGRCYHPVSEQVYLEQAGLIWGTLTVICLIIGGLFAWRAWCRNSGALGR